MGQQDVDATETVFVEEVGPTAGAATGNLPAIDEEAFPGCASIPFARPSIDDRDIEAVSEVLRGGWLTTGAASVGLEEDIADLVGGVEVVTTSSCTAALEIAAAHLHIGPGARVGVPTWTFAATALAFTRLGATAVLLDIEPGTLNLSGASLEPALESGLDAVALVHLGGRPVAKDVHDLCATARVPIVEDQAHALGARDHRGTLAGRGTAGAAISFYATKNVPAGEGGALLTDNPELADFARNHRLHGVTRDSWARRRPDDDQHYDIVEPGIKGNLPDVLAALARSQLARFDEHQARRLELALRYRSRLGEVPGVRVVPGDTSEDDAHHLMLVVLPDGADRRRTMGALADHGIGTTIHYPPLHHLTWFRANAEVAPGGLPVADSLAGRVISLPLYPGLADDAVDKVCSALGDALA